MESVRGANERADFVGADQHRIDFDVDAIALKRDWLSDRYP
jgi:hypothetical protein